MPALPDHHQPHPSPDEAAGIFATLRFERLPPATAPGLTAFLDVMRDKYANGGVLFQQFRVADNPHFAWFAQHDGLDELDFLNQLLGSAAVHQALPELTTICRIERPAQWRTDPPQLTDDLTRLVSQGGAYSTYHASAAHARQLAEDFVQHLPGGRTESATWWFLTAGWADWFCDVAWDYSVVAYDPASSTATLLCLTDSD